MQNKGILFFLLVFKFTTLLYSADQYTYSQLVEKAQKGEYHKIQGKLAHQCLGWSKDGKAAILKQITPDGPIGGFYLEFLVIQTITEQIQEKFYLVEPVAYQQFETGHLTENQKESFKKAILILKQNQIIPSQVKLQPVPYSYQQDALVIKLKTKKVKAPDPYYLSSWGGVNSITEKEKIPLITSFSAAAYFAGNNQSKTITRNIDLPYSSNLTIHGIYKNPFEERILIVYYYQLAIPDAHPDVNEIRAGFIGCHLQVGFR